MSKILISLLGTGRKAKGDNNSNNYEVTDYKIENNIYENKEFVSSAIIEHYNIDNVYFIGTNKSMWDNVSLIFSKEEDDYYLSLVDKKENGSLVINDLEELNKILNNKLSGDKSQCFIIEDGENENELWGIFDNFIEIIGNIDKDDEVFFDITHLFRSVSVILVPIVPMGMHILDTKVYSY